jgi:hypothetical protein
MKTLRHSLPVISSIAILGIALALSNTTTRVHAQGSDPNIEGTWSAIVTFDGGSFAPFRSLESFSGGGTMVQSSAVGDKSNQGVWKKTGGRTFIYTFEGFQFDPAGNFLGTLKVRQTAELDQSSNSYSGVATVEFRDATGNLVETSCARTRAIRMVAEGAACR